MDDAISYTGWLLDSPQLWKCDQHWKSWQRSYFAWNDLECTYVHVGRCNNLWSTLPIYFLFQTQMYTFLCRGINVELQL